MKHYLHVVWWCSPVSKISCKILMYFTYAKNQEAKFPLALNFISLIFKTNAILLICNIYIFALGCVVNVSSVNGMRSVSLPS